MVLAGCAFLLIRTWSGEDDWICDGEKWVKHGNPSAPMPTSGCGLEKKGRYVITSPKANEEVGMPMIIEGEAMPGFENTFSYRILDEDGSFLHESSITLQSDFGVYSPFKITVDYPYAKGRTGAIEVFEYSAKDGSEVDKVMVPIVFKKFDLAEVKVFFKNKNNDPNVLNCNKVDSVTRRVLKSQDLPKSAIEELLKGPSHVEYQNTFMTSINEGVKLQKLEIENGVATADFDGRLQEEVGGSCRVGVIRAQITQTLKQFDYVKKVIISVNGRSEDVLQP